MVSNDYGRFVFVSFDDDIVATVVVTNPYVATYVDIVTKHNLVRAYHVKTNVHGSAANRQCGTFEHLYVRINLEGRLSFYLKGCTFFDQETELSL